MEPCTPYQNHHHHSTVVTGSQRGRTCWPYMVKLMDNINCIAKTTNANLMNFNVQIIRHKWCRVVSLEVAE